MGPEYKSPDLDLPQEFALSDELNRHIDNADGYSLDAWWESLGDPVLVTLVKHSREQNLDISIALSRIAESRARLGVGRADLFPDVNAIGSYERRQNSLETSMGGTLERTTNAHSLGLSAAWELDLWGRIRRSVEAANADLSVSVEDARSVLVSVSAETALTYIDLRLAKDRREIAIRNIELQSSTVELTRDLFDAGIVSELDLAQSRTLLATTESTLPELSSLENNARNRLAVLLGYQPGSDNLSSKLGPDFGHEGHTGVPRYEGVIQGGVPAELLRRRPDIRGAERELAAATARIGVATADLYPRFTLGGTLGYESDSLDDLFSNSAGTFGIGPSFSWPIFNAGRIRSLINVQDARAAAALTAYEQSVLLALEEVENAMFSFLRALETSAALERAIVHARRTVELSSDQYRQGLVSYQSVLDSQTRLFDLEDQSAIARASITSSLVTLYRSLGGGWSTHSDTADLMSEEESSQ